MNNTTLNTLLKDYEKKKYYAELKCEKEKSDFYSAHPELADLTFKLSGLALDISKAILNHDIELENTLKSEFSKLKDQKNTMLKSLKVPARCFRADI